MNEKINDRINRLDNRVKTRCANEACVGVCGCGKKGYPWRKTKLSVLKGMSSHDFNGDDTIKISEVSLFENMWLKTQTKSI